MLLYKRVGITMKYSLDGKDQAITKVVSVLKALGADVRIDAKRADQCANVKGIPPFQKAEEIDLLLVIGGDGTILRAVRDFQSYDTPVLSVNKGTVGFMAEVAFDEIDSVIPELLTGGGEIEERSVLHVFAYRKDKEFFMGYALNEAVIAQGAIARLVDLATAVNGEELATFRADGLIVSTPTGSTAYSLAAGGPIVHPSLSATILTPINPYSFTQKPIVIPSNYSVDVVVSMKGERKDDVEVDLTLDGQVYVPLKSGDCVRVCGCDRTVKFLRRKQDTFFQTLRSKLRWGERVEG